MLPIVVVLICVGWRILKRRKAEEKEENDFMNIKSRPIDPDESMRINSDDESIPYKKDISEDSPEPTEPVRIIENPPIELGIPIQDDNLRVDNPAYPYNAPYEQAQPQPSQSRPWAGETEIN